MANLLSSGLASGLGSPLFIIASLLAGSDMSEKHILITKVRSTSVQQHTIPMPMDSQSYPTSSLIALLRARSKGNSSTPLARMLNVQPAQPAILCILVLTLFHPLHFPSHPILPPTTLPLPTDPKPTRLEIRSTILHFRQNANSSLSARNRNVVLYSTTIIST